MAAACAIPAAAQAAPEIRDVRVQAPDARFAAGEAIVRFKPGATAAARRSARSAALVEFDRSLRIPRAQLVELDGSVPAAVRRLERQPQVAYAQPNYIYRATAVTEPNDPLFSELWGLEAINALSAWEHTKGLGQTIAVVDTGVDLTHPDLQPNLWINPDPDPSANDLHGYDFVDNDGDPDDFHTHGTHVAGTAAALDGNGIGVAGVAPRANIMAIRVLDAEGRGETADVAEGIRYAADNGADVINLSLGGLAGGDDDQTMADEILHAASQEAVVVAAAGNENVDNDVVPHSPCYFPHLASQPPNLICVAATIHDGHIAHFSNWGESSVHLSAPGMSIWSTRAPYRRIYPESGGPDGFESASVFAVAWTRFSGTTAWGRTSAFKSAGSFSAADSPAGDYAPSANASMVTVNDYSFDNERGCRMHFDLRLRTGGDPSDFLDAGILHGGNQLSMYRFESDTGNTFQHVQLPFGHLDGSPLVAPALWFEADDDGTVGNGAYVDQLELMCRAYTYDASAYMSLSGTSMATPHVAGVAALARAAAIDEGRDSGSNAIVAAILDGVRPLQVTPGKPTITNGIVDACRAVAEARGVATECPAPPPPPPPPPTEETSTTTTTTPPPPSETEPVEPPLPPPLLMSPLAKPDLSPAKSRIRVRRSRFAYRFRATAGLRGRAGFRTRVRALVPTRRGTVRRHLTLARPRFTVGPRGVVRLRVRLTRKQMRILRLNRRLRLRVAVTVRDDSGRTATARKRLLLLAPR